MDKLNRLTKQGLTIRDIITISYQYYRSTNGDNKSRRADLDIVSAKIIARKNYEYNRSTKSFEQTGRDIKFEFLCKSKPISYKKTDTINIHKYPIIILIHNIDAGLDTTFKIREGSLKKPIFKNNSMTSEQLANKNILNGVDLHFIYHLMFVYRHYNILYGINYTTRPPQHTNPKLIPYLGKHSWFIMTKIMIPLLTNKAGLVKDALFRNN